MAVKKRTTKRQTPFQRVLGEVDKLLAKRNHDSQKLWNVLSALRGPDMTGDTRFDGASLKDYTTIPIRRAALPLTAKSGSGANGAMFHSGYKFKLPTHGETRSGHFRRHIKSAALALGIEI